MSGKYISQEPVSKDKQEMFTSDSTSYEEWVQIMQREESIGIHFDDAVLEAASQALAMSDQLVVKQIVLLYIHSQNDLDDHSDTDFKRLFETLKNNKTMERFHFRRCGHLMHW